MNPVPKMRQVRGLGEELIRDRRTGGWDGMAPAPGRVKQMIIKGYGKRHGAEILVETGTFMGNTAGALKRHFNRVHTIELDPRLASLAQWRFRLSRKVQVHQGDSAQVLPTLLQTLDAPVLYWLDAHYSYGITARGNIETPIVRELELVLTHPRTRAVLIDDARFFGVRAGYPTASEVGDIADQHGWTTHLELDIFRLTRSHHESAQN